MGSKKLEFYDVSPKMREVLEWRDARKKVLREKYLKESLCPTRQEIIIDEALQRYHTFKLTQEYYVKMTGKAFLVCGIVTFAFAGLISMFVKAKRDKEQQLRSGQVSYAAREFKFAL